MTDDVLEALEKDRDRLLELIKHMQEGSTRMYSDDIDITPASNRLFQTIVENKEKAMASYLAKLDTQT